MGTSAVYRDLSKWNDTIESSCPCCGEAEETVEHFLLHCSHFVSVRKEWIQALSESSWGLQHWTETFTLEDDVGKCALLLGHPRPVQKGPEDSFPAATALVFVRAMYEERSRKLDELSSEDENARAAAKKDAIRRKQQKTKLANAHAARAAEHARSKEEADSGSRVTIRSYFSTLPASKAAKKEVTESALANNSDETEDYMSDASECETQSGGCVGGGDQSSSIRAGLLGRKSRRHA